MKGFDLDNVFFYTTGVPFGKIKRIVIEGGAVWLFNKAGIMAEPNE